MRESPTVEEAVVNLDAQIEGAQKAIANLEAYERLTANPDFKLIISEMFLKEFAVQQVLQRGNTTGDSADALAANLRRIDGVGTLVSYFRNLHAYGVNQRNHLIQLERTKEQVLSGELEVEYEEED